MEKYIPISCDLYDELELAAIRATACILEIGTGSGQLRTVEARIEDLQTRNKIEYAKLSNGEEIRLDHLYTLNGKRISFSCGI